MAGVSPMGDCFMDSRATSHMGLSRGGMLALVALRVLVGWHFLYEGLVKLLAPGWTSAGYLSSSRWLLADAFHWIAATPEALRVVDVLNVLGLILIGVGLIVGCCSRLAALSGALLLALYYIAHPPFMGSDIGMPVEGSYLIVNKTLVEMIALIALAAFPTGKFLGLDRMFAYFKNRRHVALDEFSNEEETRSAARPLTARRELLASVATLPVVGAFGYAFANRRKPTSIDAMTGATITFENPTLADLKGTLPKGRIGDLEMSRVILGNNLIGGWSHSRDLIYVSKLFRAYNTEMKVFETLCTAERAGINMFNIVNDQFPLFHKYKEAMGGKIQTMCQCFPQVGDVRTDLDRAIDNGVTTMYVQGGRCDSLIRDKYIDVVAEAVEYIKSQGYVAGIGAHSIVVPMTCEEAGLNPDYYMKTCHHDQYWSAIPREQRQEFSIVAPNEADHDGFHDNMWDLFPEKTNEFMATVNKPWVGFKVLAGGAIHPNEGFRYAFENGADFICVGMFDYQIVEDVNIAIDALAATEKRARPWLA